MQPARRSRSVRVSASAWSCIEVCKGNAVLSLNMEVGHAPAARDFGDRSSVSRSVQRHRTRRSARANARARSCRWPALKQGIDKALAMYSAGGCMQLVRRMAAGRERHRRRLPARQWIAADGDQLRRAGVQGVVRVFAERGAAAIAQRLVRTDRRGLGSGARITRSRGGHSQLGYRRRASSRCERACSFTVHALFIRQENR